MEDTKKFYVQSSSKFMALSLEARIDSLWYGEGRPRWLGPIPYDYPAYLSGELSGDYGFDVAGLSKDPLALQKYFKKLDVKCSIRKCPDIIIVKWQPPLPVWVKVNTDGMATTNPAVAATGGIFRNYRGFYVGAFCQNIGRHNAFTAELAAFMQAIQFAYDKGWHMLWAELDSLSLAESLKNKCFKPPWQFLNHWRICRQQMDSMNIVISHIFREGNQAADKLSKMGTQFLNLQWWPSPPPDITSFIAKDHDVMPNYRFKGF